MHKLHFSHQYPKKCLNHFDLYSDKYSFSNLKTFWILVDLQSKDHFQEVKDTWLWLTVLITFYFVEPMFWQIHFLFILLTHFVFATIMDIWEDNIDLRLQILCWSKVKVFYMLVEGVAIYWQMFLERFPSHTVREVDLIYETEGWRAYDWQWDYR